MIKIGTIDFFAPEEKSLLNKISENYFYYLKPQNNGVIIDIDENRLLYIEGSISYYIDRSENVHRMSLNNARALRDIFLSVDLDKFINTVEGRYACILIDKKNKLITAFSDIFNRMTQYYSSFGKCHVVSTDILEILPLVKQNNFNQLSLLSVFAHYYTPGKHTIFENIYKLGVYQRIEIEYSNKKFTVRSNYVPCSSEKYSSLDLNRYKKLLENAIISRSSETENWVQLTGGLDTTVIVDVLLRAYDGNKVKVVLGGVLTPNGEYLNEMDVSRTKKICKHYNIKPEIIDTKPWANDAINHFKRDVEFLVEKSIAPHGYIFFELADFLKNSNISKSSVVFFRSKRYQDRS